MNTLVQIEETLKVEIIAAVIRAELTTEADMPDIVLSKPKDKQHGDFATNIAMQLTKIAKKAPRQIAEAIVENLNVDQAKVVKVEIAGPGFINFFMESDFLGELIPLILEAGDDYGKSVKDNPEKIQVEFVSVNPTGEPHLGHARGAAYGDALCNVLTAAGNNVEREYYINDAGNQIDNLALSIEARYLEELGETAEIPAGGYFGADIVNIAKELVAEHGDKWLQFDSDARVEDFKESGLKSLLGNIEKVLADLHVEFDHWFSERTLYQGDQIKDAIDILRAGGYVFEEDGATWFRSTDFGDDKDRVLVKQDGTYTYLMPDIAYHKNKLDRGFDKLINVWGADHHGYVPRMQAAIEALGYPEDKLTVKIIQMVSLLEKGEQLKMSKRSGNAVSLRELMEEVGVDAVRYYFVMRSIDSQLDFDVELARSESNDNPVFYVQYAYARICTMLSHAEKQGFIADEGFDPTLLVAEKEVALLTKLGDFPKVITSAATNYAPHQVTQYVYDVATLLHSFYNAEKVLDADNSALTNARIALMKAVRITIKNSLEIIGVHAPEKM